MSDSEIFKAAVKLPPDQQQDYLDQACGANHELRREVESLLREHDTSDSFLERPAAERISTHTFDHAPGETVKDAECSLDFLAPTENPDCLGTIGQYEITEVVGRGGMGIVLKGNDPKLNRVVAVKVLAPELASNASACKRFLREGRAAAAVSHDHVVTIYGIDDSGRLPFIAMEYISGPSLEDRIKSEGPLELAEILRIGMQIASGLSAAHAQGLVHRDIKPGNILLENGVEKVKITDFGLARAVDDVRMTKPGVVTGTPEYMSPEQARGESVDHRTDLFSLGSVLYAMCTGRSPFRAENTVGMIRRVCEDTPRPIEDVNPEVPGWLIQIIEELLVKPAADRFQSAAELAELLGQCLAHLQEPSVNPLPDRLQGRKFGRFARRRRTTRRRGWLAAAAAVLLLAVGGLSLTEATGVTDVAGTVIRIVRGDGTLVIHVDDPEVSVSIDGEQLVITGAGAKEIRLAVGQHQLKAVKNGKPVHTELVTITRDGKRVVEVNAEALAGAEVAEAPEATVAEIREIPPHFGMEELDVFAISCDGQRCAFVHESGSLVVRDLTTGKEQRVVEDASGLRYLSSVSISPDNKWVAYVGGDDDSGAGSDLRVVAIDGSGERVLYPNEEKSIISDLGWSSDCQHVLATLDHFDSDGSCDIVLVSVTDSSVRLLKKLSKEENAEPEPRISPDGRLVAYGRLIAGSKQEDIFLIPLDDGPETHVIEDPADDGVLGWTPDGKGLLFFSDREGGKYNVWLIRVIDGQPVGDPRPVKTADTLRWAPWSVIGPVRTPTGSWAFYTRRWVPSSSYNFTSSVYTIDLDPETGKLSGAPKQVTRPAVGRERGLTPDFSRDGKYLAYYEAPSPDRSTGEWLYRPGNIVIRSLETGQERRIKLSPQFNGGHHPNLRWSPDGRFLLARGFDEAGRDAIFRIDAGTGQLRPLVENDAQPTRDWKLHWRAVAIGEGDWSSDGKTLFYTRTHYDPSAKGKAEGEPKHTQTRILAREIATGKEREVYRIPEGTGGMFSIDVSPDGQRIAIHSPTFKATSLKVVPTAGGEHRELLRLQVSEFIPARLVAWTPDSRHLLYVKVVEKSREVWRIGAEGGPPERVGELPPALGKYVSQLRVHPNGQQVAFHTSQSVRGRDRYRPRMMQMMQSALSPERAKEGCIANLKTLAGAIQRYKDDHGEEPDWLSDLYPDYLQDKGLLRCPEDGRGETGITSRYSADPKMPCSYEYRFNNKATSVGAMRLPVTIPPDESGMTKKKGSGLQRKYYGDVVPIVVCEHHSPDLNLGCDGEIYEADVWERSPQALAGLLSQLQRAMQSNPGTWAERYDIMPNLLWLLDDRVPLTELLQSHAEAHPGEAGEAARQTLDEFRRIRFIARSEDDAAEYGSGRMNLDGTNLSLRDSPNRAPEYEVQFVGLRFADIQVPKGARIKRAYMEFQTAGSGLAEIKSLLVHGERASDADSFTDVSHNISSRRKTTASVECPELWKNLSSGSRSLTVTPNLASIIQEVVDQPDWQEGNAMVLIISGSAKCGVRSFDHSGGRRPMLYVEH